jgi:hypothetical protein
VIWSRCHVSKDKFTKGKKKEKSLYHISKPQVAQEEKATTKLENSGDDQTQPSITVRHV